MIESELSWPEHIETVKKTTAVRASHLVLIYGYEARLVWNTWVIYHESDRRQAVWEVMELRDAIRFAATN